MAPTASGSKSLAEFSVWAPWTFAKACRMSILGLCFSSNALRASFRLRPLSHTCATSTATSSNA
eukprot:scaffold6910_cov33-Prasinocladus_malaysianus.AAC.1